MRDGLCVAMGKLLWNRPKEVSLKQARTNDFEMRDFLVYMSAHAIATFSSLSVLAYACYSSQLFHGAILWLLVVICTYRGAMRYTYYSTKMYTKIIQSKFVDEINRQAEIIVNQSMSKESVDEFATESTPLKEN